MAHEFRVGDDRDQCYLLPPDVREWLPPQHLAWFVIETVEQLDLSALRSAYRLGGVGRSAYDPALLTGLLFYGYATGVRSSRALERACHTDVACRVLMRNVCPDHATIARFRAVHAEALAGLFTQVLGLCVDAGLVDARLVAVDGSRVGAAASLNANRTRAQLEAEARRMLDQSAAVDAAEDARFGPDRRGDEPAPGWEPGRDRAGRIRQALEKLNAQPDGREDIQARQAARAAQGKPRRGRPPLPADPAKPQRVANGGGKAQRRANLTDPDSQLMKTSGGYDQAYNAQAVAGGGQLILAADVTDQHNDNQQLAGMLDHARRNLTDAGATGRSGHIRTALADRGYWNRTTIDSLTHQRIRALVATRKDRDLRTAADSAPTDPTDTDSCTPNQRMSRLLAIPAARTLYQRRSAMIEPVFANLKANLGFTRFCRRGLPAVRAEWKLACTVHNLLKLRTATLQPAA